MPQQQNRQQWTRRDFLGALTGQTATYDHEMPPPLRVDVPLITRNEHLPPVVARSAPSFVGDSFTVTGMVEREMVVDYDLGKKFRLVGQERPVIDRVYIPANGLLGNAIWYGVCLADVLSEAVLLANAVSITFKNDLGRAVTVPFRWAEDIFLATGVNAAPLPHEQGYPLRVLLPFGYAQDAIGRLTEIVLCDTPPSFDDAAAVIPFAQVLAPQHLAQVPVGQPVTLFGIALDQASGAVGVHVSINGADPMPVPLHQATSNVAWHMWQTQFVPAYPGDYELVASVASRSDQQHDHHIVLRAV